jgi:alkylhydroperoxidase/carboxymuconolactone decarboxylase family protein YurZ
MTMPNIPAWKVKLEKHVPDLAQQMIQIQGKVLTEGALSVKTKTLMMLVCDALLAHPDGVTGLANRARALGASEDEIAETMAVAFLMGGLPALVTGASALRDE